MIADPALDSTNPRVLFPTPHGGQRHVLTNRRRFNILTAGRRWFKTTMDAQLSIETMLRGGWAICGAPTYDQCRTMYEEAHRMGFAVARFNESRMEARCKYSQGRILWRSMDDPDNARSKTAHRVIIDEFCDVHKDAWFRVLRAMLMTTGGDAWFTGTPKGHNWGYQLWNYAREAGGPWATFQCPTLGFEIVGDTIERRPHPHENPTIPWEELLEVWDQTPERVFREEYGAEFLEDSAGVFRNIGACATLQPLPDPEPGHSYFIGADWGQSKDYSVFVVWDATKNREVALDRFRRVEYPVVEMRFKELVRKWRPIGVVAEENSIGKPIIEHLRRQGVRITPFLATNASNQEWVDMLALAFERRSIGIINDETHVAELKAFRGERLPGGRWRYSAPEGQHDDTVDALGLAVWGASKVTRPATSKQRRGVMAAIA